MRSSRTYLAALVANRAEALEKCQHDLASMTKLHAQARAEIKGLNEAIQEALTICDGCCGRGITANKLVNVLRKALGEDGQ